jgi:hypothetical protein
MHVPQGDTYDSQFSQAGSNPTVTPVRNDPVNAACRTLIEVSMGCEEDLAMYKVPKTEAAEPGSAKWCCRTRRGLRWNVSRKAPLSAAFGSHTTSLEPVRVVPLQSPRIMVDEGEHCLVPDAGVVGLGAWLRRGHCYWYTRRSDAGRLFARGYSRIFGTSKLYP